MNWECRFKLVVSELGAQNSIYSSSKSNKNKNKNKKENKRKYHNEGVASLPLLLLGR